MIDLTRAIKELDRVMAESLGKKSKKQILSENKDLFDLFDYANALDDLYYARTH